MSPIRPALGKKTVARPGGEALTIRFTRKSTWAASFEYRDFRLLWLSTFLFALGTGMEHVAVGWLVFEITGSAFMVGVASGARMAPFFFLGVLSGVVADWLERRLLLRVSTFSGTVVAAVMAVLLLAGGAGVWSILVLVTAGGCIFAFVLTTRQAYVLDIVGPENALNGLALSAMAMQAGGIAGSIISGTLIEAVGPGWQYVAVGASYALAGLVLIGMTEPGRATEGRRESVLENLAGYIRLIRQNRVLLILMCLASITEVFGFTHMTLLPVFAKEVLFVGPVGLGFMTAVRQGGGLLGLALLASLRDYRRKGLLMFIIAVGFGAGLMAFSLSANLFVFLVVLAVVNACAMAVDTLYKTLMQENVANEQRGRAMGSWTLSIGVAPVGHLGVGALAGFLGAPGALLVNGAVLAFVSIAAAAGLPKIRRLE